MRCLVRIVSSLLLCLGTAYAGVPAAIAPPAEIGKPLPAFQAELIELTPTAEKTVSFDSQKNQKVTALIIVGTHCPSTAAYSERMAQLAKTYAAKGVEVIFVYPSRDEDHAAKVAFHRQKNFAGYLIDDTDGRIGRLLGAQRTTEVFVTDKQGRLVYHGAIDDNRDDADAVKEHYAATALDLTLEGKPVTKISSQVFACQIHY